MNPISLKQCSALQFPREKNVLLNIQAVCLNVDLHNCISKTPNLDSSECIIHLCSYCYLSKGHSIEGNSFIIKSSIFLAIKFFESGAVKAIICLSIL